MGEGFLFLLLFKQLYAVFFNFKNVVFLEALARTHILAVKGKRYATLAEFVLNGDQRVKRALALNKLLRYPSR